MVLALADDLRSECGSGASAELGVVVLEDVELLLDLIDSARGNVASLLEAIGNFQRVDAAVQKFLGLLEDGTSEDDNTSRAVTDLIILRRRKLSQQAGSLVVDLNG